MTLIIFYIALLAWICQIVYLLYISVWPKHPDEPLPTAQKQVTVLICAKNEEQRLGELLPLLIRQKYPNFKILIVNDGSTDHTAEVVRSWQQRYPDKIQLFSLLNKNIPGKKGAIYEALPHIHSEFILFTDADCRPGSFEWIALMIGKMEKDKADIILGYSPVFGQKGFTGTLEAWHNAWTAWQYLGAAFQGRPYMSVGRNWGVRTELYKKYQNILSHQHILSGDDDLVFQSLAESGRVSVLVTPPSWMWTHPRPDLRSFLWQRVRHSEAGLSYPLSQQILLAIFPFSVMIAFISILFLLLKMPLVGLTLVLLHFISWMLPARSILPRLGRKSLYWKVPFLLPFELFLQGSVFLLTLLGMKGRWK